MTRWPESSCFVVKITLSISERTETGNSALGLSLVNSFNLLPRPAAIIKAFILYIRPMRLCVVRYSECALKESQNYQNRGNL